MTVMPALKSAGAHYKYISSAGGLTAKSLANKYGFEFSTTDYKHILNDQEVDLVMITTRHDLHAKMVIETIASGKNVFVEKPLAINGEELDAVLNAYNNQIIPKSISVGFNRRFSPFSKKIKALIGTTTDSLNMIATINAGFIPPDVWVHDMKTGGGRIIGEACHFIDLMVYFTGSKVAEVSMSALGKTPTEQTDNAIITLKFQNGSQGVINYFSNGSKSYQKERVEIYSQGRTLILDNFRKLEGFGFKGFSTMRGALDKGHKCQFIELITKIKSGGESIISFEEIYYTTKASLAAVKSMQVGGWIKL